MQTDSRDGQPRESVADQPIGEAATTMWAGDFGNEYTKRNTVAWEDRIPLLRRMVERTGATRFLDVGCNAGWNLRALKSISPEFEMSGVDINHGALELAAAEGFDVVNASAGEVSELFGCGVADLVITSGVLIHIPSEHLTAAMVAIRDVSAGYVLAIEYESEQEEMVEYRGIQDRLWRRPYGALYEQLGLSIEEHGIAEGYDRCAYWLLAKGNV